MTPLIKKIMAMARKTGDRCIIVDSSGEDAFVLMDLASYERLAEVAPPSKRDDLPRLTAFPNAYNIKPVVSKEPDDIPLEAFVDESNSLAELSEEKIRQEERFHLEPLE